jgi:hypothetical protein
MQQADRVVCGIIRAERVGTDEFGETFGAMGFGHPTRTHLVQDDGNAALRDLPSGLGAREAGANDVHMCREGSPCHSGQVAPFPREWNAQWQGDLGRNGNARDEAGVICSDVRCFAAD